MIPLPVETVPPCTGCGACCKTIGLPPFEVANPDFGPVLVDAARWMPDLMHDRRVRDTELFLDMPPELRAEHAAMMRGLAEAPIDRPCAWLDPATGACRHYEWRPAVCRDWEVGCDGCLAARTGQALVVWRAAATPPYEWLNPRAPLRRIP